MNKDLGLSAYVFGWGAGIFFLGYFLFEVIDTRSRQRGTVTLSAPLRLVFVLGLDLLLLLHDGLFACTRLGEWRRGVRVLVRQSLPNLRHL
jgi:hypothetical protein